jgi:hypothetical protein
MSDPLLEELRRQYRESARERLEEVAGLLERVSGFLGVPRSSSGSSEDAADLSRGTPRNSEEPEEHDEPDELRLLARHFHGFAGMGATYGFPRVSEIGDELEASIGPLIRDAVLPDAATVARWRELAGEIARELC